MSTVIYLLRRTSPWPLLVPAFSVILDRGHTVSGKRMRTLDHLFENNKRWAAGMTSGDPDFFQRLAAQQNPEFLWLGCSDSRVPANDVVGLLPGELFVHRNVGNVVSHSDMNCLSVIQYAVEILRVKHIIVCGHYGCGGVRAAMEHKALGLIDNWLHNIKDIYERHRFALEREPEEKRLDRLCELNVIRQAANVCHTSFVQNAWRQGRELSVHGWIYSIKDGILRDLGVRFTDFEQLSPVYRFDEIPTPAANCFGPPVEFTRHNTQPTGATDRTSGTI